MSDWNPERYLQFERERTLPCRDLVSRIELASSFKIVDLGCGPGNSTAVLAGRWPGAEINGIDSSPHMLELARSSAFRANWLLEDIGKWNPRDSYDLIFSNAALQWVSNHEKEIPRLFDFVTRGGALAFQIPTHTDLWFEVLERLIKSANWTKYFLKRSPDFFSHQLTFYYDLLAAKAAKVDLWETKYIHVLSSPKSVVDWVRGTALRPLLEGLPDETQKAEFLKEYTREITRAYPREPNGNVLFPFLRRFVVAYR